MPEDKSIPDKIFASTIRDQAYADKYSLALNKEVQSLLTAAQDDIVAALAKNDPTSPTMTKWKQARLETLNKDITKIVDSTYKNVNSTTNNGLMKVGNLQTGATAAGINKAIGVDIFNVTVTPADVKAIVGNTLIDGKTIGGWWNKQSADLKSKLSASMADGTKALQIGMVEGEGIGGLVKRIRGSKDKPGIMDISKREAEALVRTSVMQVSGAVRQELYKGNADILDGIEVVATLDNRTTPLCRALDGKRYDMNLNPIGHGMPYPGGPPFHWGCRSTIVPLTKSWAELAGSASKLTPDQIRELDENVPVGQRASMHGPVSANQTYQDWLRDQPQSVQEDILGKARYKLWSENKLDVGDLVTNTGHSLTIKELAYRYEELYSIVAPEAPEAISGVVAVERPGWVPITSKAEAIKIFEEQFNIEELVVGNIAAKNNMERINAIGQALSDIKMLPRYTDRELPWMSTFRLETTSLVETGNGRLVDAFYNPDGRRITIGMKGKRLDDVFRVGDFSTTGNIGSIARHEYGHHLWNTSLTSPERIEWITFFKSKPKDWWYKNVSFYAGDVGSKEAFAESFSAWTSRVYGIGAKRNLPKEVEEYFTKVFGKPTVSSAKVEIDIPAAAKWKSLTTQQKLVEELKFQGSAEERWARLHELSGPSQKVGVVDRTIYRGFRNKADMESFLAGNFKPMTNISGTGTFFSFDASMAKSYGDTLLELKLPKNFITQKELDRRVISSLESYGGKYGKQEATKLWNILKDPGISSKFYGYDAVLLNDGNVILNNLAKKLLPVSDDLAMVSARVERARASHLPATRSVQIVARENQTLAALKTGGIEQPDNHPFDVIRGKDHIEVKTIVRAKNDKITMHPESLQLKADFIKDIKGARTHTLVIDERTGLVYYKSGLGSFNLSTMEVIGTKENFGPNLLRRMAGKPIKKVVVKADEAVIIKDVSPLPNIPENINRSYSKFTNYDKALSAVSEGGTPQTKKLLQEAIKEEPGRIAALQGEIIKRQGKEVTLYRLTRGRALSGIESFTDDINIARREGTDLTLKVPVEAIVGYAKYQPNALRRGLFTESEVLVDTSKIKLPQAVSKPGEIIKDPKSPYQTHLPGDRGPLKDRVLDFYLTDSTGSRAWQVMAGKEYGINPAEQTLRMASKSEIDSLAKDYAAMGKMGKNGVYSRGIYPHEYMKLSPKEKMPYIIEAEDAYRKSFTDMLKYARGNPEYYNPKAFDRTIRELKEEAASVMKGDETVYRGIRLDKDRIAEIKEAIEKYGEYRLPVMPVSSYSQDANIARRFSRYGGTESATKGERLVYSYKATKNNTWIHTDSPTFKAYREAMKKKGENFYIGGTNQRELVVGHPQGYVILTKENAEFL